MKLVAASVALCLISIVLFTLSAVQRSHDQESVRDLALQARALSEDGKVAKQALCAFYDDLQRRYILGLEFLSDHPDGVGEITRSDIVRSLNNQSATLDALSLYLDDC